MTAYIFYTPPGLEITENLDKRDCRKVMKPTINFWKKKF